MIGRHRFPTGCRLAVPVMAMLAVAAPALAQGSAQTVQDVLGFIVTNRGFLADDFDKDSAAADATRETLTTALLSSVATLPIATSASGFTYRLNPTLGTVERAASTFGPSYVERALTAGAGQASFGFTLRHASFNKLDGNDLRNGDFVTVANQFTDEPAPFDVETLTLEIESQTATVFANIGVSDRVDVGVAVPLVRLTLDGTRVNNYRGTSYLLARASARTTGFADIAIRSKVRLTPAASPAAVAGAVEARLPTGREEDLLGAGELAMRFLGIASYEAGRAGVFGNFVVGTGGLGREVSYGGAVSVAATPRLTLVGEVMLRRLAGVRPVIADVEAHPRVSGVLTTRLLPGGADEITAFTVAGLKWNIGGAWLLHTNVLMPLAENGLTARFTPTVALDYSFAR
jgi:hypothetical protein